MKPTPQKESTVRFVRAVIYNIGYLQGRVSAVRRYLENTQGLSQSTLDQLAAYHQALQVRLHDVSWPLQVWAPRLRLSPILRQEIVAGRLHGRAAALAYCRIASGLDLDRN